MRETEMVARGRREIGLTVLLVLSSASGAVALPLIPILAAGQRYVLTVLAAVVLAHACYAAPYYSRALRQGREARRTAALLLSGTDSLRDLSEQLGLREEVVRRRLLLAVRLGYLKQPLASALEQISNEEQGAEMPSDAHAR